jgi:hypothetical protein
MSAANCQVPQSERQIKQHRRERPSDNRHTHRDVVGQEDQVSQSVTTESGGQRSPVLGPIPNGPKLVQSQLVLTLIEQVTFELINSVRQKPILEFSAANPFPEELPTPATPVLLHIKSQHHTSRLANKNLILTDPPLTGPALEEGKRKREAIQKGNRKRALASKSELERWEKEKEVGEKRKRTGLSDRKSSRKIWGLQAGSSIQ